ncbi:MAG: N-acetylmuramoyl-L-alanine amidase, partial [Muribaculaceae bacterium]|nr:N-acetylmuramoyl-L-alanine amidase [Muribaculaceae bacterium]
YSAEKSSDFVVVIDAGHGGNDTGAIDNGVKEKDINLSVAKYLQEDLQKKIKGVKVVMTRSNDTFVTLQGRADIANRNRADLFISIHTNSVDAKNPNRKSVSGSSVYALGLHKDKDNLNVAKRENSVIELEKNHEEKYSGFDPSKDESYIIFEMAQKKNLEQSLRFANYAQKQLVNYAGRKDRGVKQAGFWVLWATSMPAVLVELDFICNPTSAAFMGSSAGEKKMAEALGNAVVQYYNTIKSPATHNLVTSQKKSEIESEKKVELATVTKSKRTDTPPVSNYNKETGRRLTTARKRRSASSKVASDRRNVETASIVVKSESDYLAKANEKPTVVKQEKREAIKETPKEKKKRLALEKKRKEKELKEKETLRKKQAKTLEEQKKKERNQKNSSNNNKSNMKIVVNKDGTVVKTGPTQNSNSNSASSVLVKKRKSLNSKKK